NGIVNVGAKDKATGKEQAIRIQASGGLSDADIEQMVQDAEANAEEDKKRKEQVEVRNQADSLIYSTEKNLNEFGDKVPDEDKSQIEGDVAALREALGGEDIEDITAKTEALSQSAMKLGEIMYKAQQEAEAAGEGAPDMDGAPGFDDAAAGGDGADDDGATVVDADFEEVDDDRKDNTA
ncbi:MAG: Hsp70 family protein, partial [Rhodospirillaceae bacterium]|nr:Hsp70 family protein [Rhodospirillaceae bacterium]